MIQELKMTNAEVMLAVEQYLVGKVFGSEYGAAIAVTKLEQEKSGSYGSNGFTVTIDKKPEPEKVS